MKKTICIISLSQIKHDSRVLRQIEFLSHKYKLVIIGLGSAPSDFAGNAAVQWHKIQRSDYKILALTQKLFERFIQIPIFPKTHQAYHLAVNSKWDVILANNWDALPMSALAAMRNQAKLVLDVHESYKSWYWGLTAPIISYIFKKYTTEIDASTTVVNTLANEHKKFDLSPVVIRNIPTTPSKKVTFRKTDPENIKLIHHGVATKKRRTDLMIKTIVTADERYELHLVFVNIQSSYVKTLQKLSSRIAPGRVFFHPPYPPSEIVNNIANFDIGFYPLPPINFNQRIALPNKLFEFISAGLAILIGPSPSMAEVVKQHHCGLISPDFSPKSLSNILNKTTTEEWDQMKVASLQATSELNADEEMEKLLCLFSELLND